MESMPFSPAPDSFSQGNSDNLGWWLLCCQQTVSLSADKSPWSTIHFSFKSVLTKMWLLEEMLVKLAKLYKVYGAYIVCVAFSGSLIILE